MTQSPDSSLATVLLVGFNTHLLGPLLQARKPAGQTGLGFRLRLDLLRAIPPRGGRVDNYFPLLLGLLMLLDVGANVLAFPDAQRRAREVINVQARREAVEHQ